MPVLASFFQSSSKYQPLKGPQRLIFSAILATFQSLFERRTINFSQKQNHICNALSIGFYG